MLGFRADPPDRLRPLLQELTTLHQAYTEQPIFGVEMNWGNEVRDTLEKCYAVVVTSLKSRTDIKFVECTLFR